MLAITSSLGTYPCVLTSVRPLTYSQLPTKAIDLALQRVLILSLSSLQVARSLPLHVAPQCCSDLPFVVETAALRGETPLLESLGALRL